MAAVKQPVTVSAASSVEVMSDGLDGQQSYQVDDPDDHQSLMQTASNVKMQVDGQRDH